MNDDELLQAVEDKAAWSEDEATFGEPWRERAEAWRRLAELLRDDEGQSSNWKGP